MSPNLLAPLPGAIQQGLEDPSLARPGCVGCDGAMQTTISIDSALLEQARHYAKSAGMTWNDFAEQALRSHLESVDPDGAKAVEPTGEMTHFVVVPDELAAAEGEHSYAWQR